MGRLNYISQFITHLMDKCDLIFKLLKKHDSGEWDDDYQKAFNRVKEYLTNPPILVPSVSKRPLILYLAIHERSMGCLLGQHDETEKKEGVISYLSKKFTIYEIRYPLVEKIWLLKDYDSICCVIPHGWSQRWIPSNTSLKSPPYKEELQDDKFNCLNMTYNTSLRRP